ncbi:MAG: D-alanine--D-serine ligase VanG [Lachnospiraceae bacterium]|nr:D-alanine--D-serine ligase VanG [Lachnospiraceae bacterium]
MDKAQKPTIAILFGGCSPEYGVSLQSAHAVITHLDTNLYTFVLIGISQTGEWYRFNGNHDKIKNDTWNNSADCVRANISPCRSIRGLVELTQGEISITKIDAAFPVLHGKNGEDGTVQGLLELAGIPIVGCNTLSSALCMDKDRAHKTAYLAGINVPKSFVLSKASVGDKAKTVEANADELGYPLFIKPIRAGSSFGISKVLNQDELSAATELAFRYDNRIIIEQCINGIEIGCAVLGNEDLIVGELDEIELSDGFFDHQEKYTLETSAIHVPARIPPSTAADIKAMAKIAYQALGCSGFARVDFFLNPDGEIFFNEANTIPGFTLHSRYPNMLKAIGMSFADVVNMAVSLALNS